MRSVRQPAVAGYFYSANPKALRREIENFLLDIPLHPGVEHIYGIISPHAGYTYSGKTAAYGFAQLKGKSYSSVVVVAPSHREYFPGVSLYDGDAYETPLGIVEVDKEKTALIKQSSPSFLLGKSGHKGEHSLEVQIPFLQVVLGEFKIVPIVVGDQSEGFLNELADGLGKIFDDQTLFVASSDLSHFHSSEEADKLDRLVEEGINNFDYRQLLKNSGQGKLEACGVGPIISVMKGLADKGVNKSSVLHRCNSGDVSGDHSEVVGYLSAILFK